MPLYISWTDSPFITNSLILLDMEKETLPFKRKGIQIQVVKLFKNNANLPVQIFYKTHAPLLDIVVTLMFCLYPPSSII